MTTVRTDIPRQRWVRIVPIVFLMYTIAFIDRSNLGVALPAMSKHLGFGSSTSGLAFGIFFIGYLVLQIPGGHLAERWSAKWYVFVALLLWGVLSAATGFVQDVTQLLVVRFLLGVVEGGVWPAALVLIGRWFPRQERARANSLWMLCIPVGPLVASPISGYILGSTGNYTLMFVLEAAPAFVWAALWGIFIQDRPRQSALLSATERDYLESTLEKEREDRDRPDLSTYSKALTSPIAWLFGLIYFGITLPAQGLLSFFPSLLAQTGMSIGVVGVVNALPSAVSIIGLVVVGRLSDRSMKRRRWVAIPAVVVGAGTIVSALTHSVPTLSIVILIACSLGLYSFLSPLWTVIDQVIPAVTVGATMGLISGLGNLAGFVGPYVVGLLDTATGSFVSGLLFLGICAVLAGPLIMLVKAREGASGATTPEPVVAHQADGESVA